ncbi:MAG: AsmA family protein [Hyphomicrobiales bacterium]|nr:MAG: AsmA family protein [Hyphomicrobiales bacterium]
MLNRLFVIIGFLVIIAIGAAFVIPRFIQWGDYRTRLEAMATEAFGAPVAITGDIQLTLLPQPLIVFTKVRVGPEDDPAMEVGKVEAEFSLFDFLSDRYKVTRLELEQPVINVAINENGAINSGFALAEEAGQSNVSIANADVVGGVVRLADARSGESYAAENISGELRLEALKGPFSFNGSARLDGADYGVRVAAGKLDDNGATTLSFGVRAADNSFTLDSSGALTPGPAPKYAGDVVYRRPPPRPVEGQELDAGRGDLVLEGKVEAVADRVLLSNYTLLPDENRGATRLTGAAELKLGAGMAFNAVVSGGVIALPPRDATTEVTDPPYELVRLLGETPLPPIPGISGTIGLDVTELNLRGVSLRNLRLDASTDAQGWKITDFAATLAGNTQMGLTGNLSVVDGRPIFAGAVSFESQQLDRLAALWRKPPADNPLFNMPGSMVSDVALSSDTLTLSAGRLIVSGINQEFDAMIGFGPMRALQLDVHFTTLGPSESAAVAALLPDVTGSGSFGATFPKGAVSVSASKATLFGLSGSDLVLQAAWEGGVLELSRVAAADLGGAAFDAKLTAFGTLAKPEVSGSGVLEIADGAPVLDALLGHVSTPPAVTEFLHRSLPADVNFTLAAPSGDGGQALNVSGKLATSTVKLDAKLAAGIVNALSAPINASLDLQSPSSTLMTTQLGLGDVALFSDRMPLHLSATADGVPTESYKVTARLEGGRDHLTFAGNVVPGDFTRISGDGTIDAAMADTSPLVELLGAGGVYVPPVTGRAQIAFSGLESLKLTGIEAGGVTGELAMSRRDGRVSVDGELTIPTLDARSLLTVLAGPSGTIGGEGLWPDGPFDIGMAPRASEGRVDVRVPVVTADGKPLVTEARFGLDWSRDSVSLRNFSGKAGTGTLSVDATVCCSNPALPAKRLNGRVALNGVPLDLVMPAAVGAELDGVLDASAAFDGTGETLAAAIEVMTGTGSYTISQFTAAAFDPQVFASAGAMSDVVELTPEALSAAVTERLKAGPFASGMFTGSFSIAGGVIRSPNLAIAGDGARIFGGGNLALRDLVIDARYAMSPTAPAGEDSAVDATTAEVAALVTGPLWAPVASYDVASLVEGMKIKASEIELARLEQLRLEDEARQAAAAAERLRVAEEQAVAAAARKAAEDEAKRKAAAEAAARASSEPPPPMDLGL